MKVRVTWTLTHYKTAVVEADSVSDAEDMVLSGDDAIHKSARIYDISVDDVQGIPDAVLDVLNSK